jgi:hypothetical protein
MSLELLGSNLREIFVAIHDDNSQELDLVPNGFGTRLYHVSEGWGRLWKWFFNIIELFIGEGFEKEKLQEALEKTHTIFKKEVSSIQEHIKNYNSYLQAIIDGNMVKESYHDVCHSITNWYRETAVFTSLAQRKENEKLSKLFQQHYNMEEFPFSCTYDEQELQKIQKIIDLEGLFQKPLPLFILKKLATAQEITESESQKLQSWIAKINKNDRIDLEIFHEGLRACVDCFSTKQPPADLSILELALADRKCELFDRPDQAHMRWRKSLKSGDNIQCNGKQIKIGDPVGAKFTELDRHIIFTVEDDPQEIIVIGINKAVLSLEYRIMQDKCAGTYFPNYIDVDAQGICARVERLKRSLDRVVWVGSDSLDPTDKNTAEPIANLMKYWIKNKITLQDMSLKNFMFSNDDILKYAKINFPVDIDYIALEDFVLACSKGNLAIFLYLVKNSTLNLQTYRQLYTCMMQHALNNEEKKAEEAASILRIDDPKIFIRANQLYNEVRLLKEKCCSTIFENFIVNDRDLLSTTVNKNIKDFHLKTHSGGIIWHSAEQAVIDSTTEAMKLTPRSDQ